MPEAFDRLQVRRPLNEHDRYDGREAARAFACAALVALTVAWAAALGPLGWDGLVAFGLVGGPIAVGLWYHGSRGAVRQ